MYFAQRYNLTTFQMHTLKDAVHRQNQRLLNFIMQIKEDCGRRKLPFNTFSCHFLKDLSTYCSADVVGWLADVRLWLKRQSGISRSFSRGHGTQVGSPLPAPAEEGSPATLGPTWTPSTGQPSSWAPDPGTWSTDRWGEPGGGFVTVILEGWRGRVLRGVQ